MTHLLLSRDTANSKLTPGNIHFKNQFVQENVGLCTGKPPQASEVDDAVWSI